MRTTLSFTADMFAWVDTQAMCGSAGEPERERARARQSVSGEDGDERSAAGASRTGVRQGELVVV